VRKTSLSTQRKAGCAATGTMARGEQQQQRAQLSLQAFVAPHLLHTPRRCQPAAVPVREQVRWRTAVRRFSGEKPASDAETAEVARDVPKRELAQQNLELKERDEDLAYHARQVVKTVFVSVKNFLFQGPVIFVSGLVSGVVLLTAVLLVPESVISSEATRQKVTLFEMIMQDLSRNYVEPIDEEKLFETGMRAMLGSLDPYTQFENNIQAREMNMKTMGKYGGVGLGLAPDIREPTRLVVVSAFEGYSYDVGVRPGDFIEQVDAVDVSGMSTDVVTEMLRGSPGTSVELAVSREGHDGLLRFRLMRRYISLHDVPAASILDRNNGIGYVRLQSFAKDAAGELRNALVNLQREGDLTGLILDLRGNPGGLLNSAVEVSEALVPKGSLIVSTKGRDMEVMESYYSSRNPILPGSVRLAVLVNGQTASAAEIVAGAVQDLDLGVIVGSRTFGKGLIQNIQELPFRTALRYTVGRYFTPSGRCIQALDYSFGRGVYTATEKQDKDRLEFKTQNGRTVRDGGGIDVDVPIPSPSISELEAALADQGLYFYFANKYAASVNEQLPSSFTVSDKLYNDFVNFVDGSDFRFKSRLDVELNVLQNLMTAEGYVDAGNDVDGLRTTLSNEMRLDFVKHREEIRKRLEQAIRYRLQKDSVRLLAEAERDEQVQKALDLLKDRGHYTELLKPANVDAKLASAFSYEEP